MVFVYVYTGRRQPANALPFLSICFDLGPLFQSILPPQATFETIQNQMLYFRNKYFIKFWSHPINILFNAHAKQTHPSTLIRDVSGCFKSYVLKLFGFVFFLPNVIMIGREFSAGLAKE